MFFLSDISSFFICAELIVRLYSKAFLSITHGRCWELHVCSLG